MVFFFLIILVGIGIGALFIRIPLQSSAPGHNFLPLYTAIAYSVLFLFYAAFLLGRDVQLFPALLFVLIAGNIANIFLGIKGERGLLYSRFFYIYLAYSIVTFGIVYMLWAFLYVASWA